MFLPSVLYKGGLMRFKGSPGVIEESVYFLINIFFYCSGLEGNGGWGQVGKGKKQKQKNYAMLMQNYYAFKVDIKLFDVEVERSYVAVQNYGRVHFGKI